MYVIGLFMIIVLKICDWILEIEFRIYIYIVLYVLVVVILLVNLLYIFCKFLIVNVCEK